MADAWSSTFERIINRAIGEEIGESAFQASVGLERAWNKRDTRTGTQIEQPIYTGEDGTAAMFAIHSASSVSGTYTDATETFSSGVAGSNLYHEPSKLINLVIPFRPAGDNIRFSEIRLKMAAGQKVELYNYFKEQAQLLKLSMMKLLGNQYINGTGGTGTDLAGQAHLFAQGGSFMSQVRTQSNALYPSLFNASDAAATTVSGTLSATAGSRVVTGSSTSWGSTVSIYPGAKLTIGTAVYTVRAVNSTVSMEVTPAIAATVTETTTATITTAFVDTTTYGASGAVSLAKIDKAYWDCTDGPFEPSLMLCRGDMFGAIAARMIANQRYASQDNKVGVKKRQSFMYNNAELFIDNYVPSGQVNGINEEFQTLYALQGMDKVALVEGSLQRDISSYQRASYVAEVNVVLNVSNRAPNRNFMVKGFSV